MSQRLNKNRIYEFPSIYRSAMISWKKMQKGESSKFGIYLILISGFISIFLLPAFFIQHAPQISWWPTFIGHGEVGDAINGIAGPFIAIGGVMITFLAFYIQVQANKLQIKNFRETTIQFRQQLDVQQKQFGDQQKLNNVERFESRYFELLKIHKENTAEISIEIPNTDKKYTGRDAFQKLYDEFKLSYTLIDTFLNNSESKIKDIASEDIDAIRKFTGSEKADFSLHDTELITSISYTIFFLGANDKSWDLIFAVLKKHSNERYMLYLIFWLTKFSRDYEDIIGDSNKVFNHIEKYSNNELIGMHILDYVPLNGHISRLGHYYRHLYQIVRFVDSYDERIITKEEKYIYLKMLRSQLSAHEQIMLYYNSLSSGGEKWITEGFMEKYRVIKNIPLPLTEFAYKPEDKFKNEIEALAKKKIAFFEWHE